jgi:hypothetical protein
MDARREVGDPQSTAGMPPQKKRTYILDKPNVI